MNDPMPVLRAAVLAAGSAILDMQQAGFSVTRKSNNDVLTQADLLANDMLKERLLGAFPDFGWLSEESVDDSERLTAQYVWVVDPIDGTREYAKGIPEYAISVALVEFGVPRLACVFNPATNEFFHAEKGKGAWLWEQRIYCADNDVLRLRLLASHSEMLRGEWDAFLTQNEVKSIGSIAYKLALIAAGKAHATFSLGPKNEWDIAAGVLLVEEAGGMVTDKAHLAFLFNQKNVLVNGIVATAKSAEQQVWRMIAAHVI